MIPSLKSKLLNYVYEQTTTGGKQFVTTWHLEQYAIALGATGSNATRRARELVEDGKLKAVKGSYPITGKVHMRYSMPKNEANTA